MAPSKDKANFPGRHLTGLLGYGSSFDGEIIFEGMFRIDGNVSGRVVCPKETVSMVVVTKHSVVEADIVADVVLVSGRVLGNVLATKKIEVAASGRLEGMIFHR